MDGTKTEDDALKDESAKTIKEVRDIVVDCAGEWSAWECPNGKKVGTKSRTFTVEYWARNGGRTCPKPLIQRENIKVDCKFNNLKVTCEDNTTTRTYNVLQQPKNGGTPCPKQTEPNSCASAEEDVLLQQHDYHDGNMHFKGKSCTTCDDMKERLDKLEALTDCRQCQRSTSKHVSLNDCAIKGGAIACKRGDTTKCFCTKDPVKCNDEHPLFSNHWVGTGAYVTYNNTHAAILADVTGAPILRHDWKITQKKYCHDSDGITYPTDGTLSNYSARQKHKFLKTDVETKFLTRDSTFCPVTHPLKVCHLTKGCFCSKTEDKCESWRADAGSQFSTVEKFRRPNKKRSLLIARMDHGKPSGTTLTCGAETLELNEYADDHKQAFQRPWYQYPYEQGVYEKKDTICPAYHNNDIAVCQPTCEDPRKCTKAEIEKQCNHNRNTTPLSAGQLGTHPRKRTKCDEQAVVRVPQLAWSHPAKTEHECTKPRLRSYAQTVSCKDSRTNSQCTVVKVGERGQRADDAKEDYYLVPKEHTCPDIVDSNNWYGKEYSFSGTASDDTFQVTRTPYNTTHDRVTVKRIDGNHCGSKNPCKICINKDTGQEIRAKPYASKISYDEKCKNEGGTWVSLKTAGLTRSWDIDLQFRCCKADKVDTELEALGYSTYTKKAHFPGATGSYIEDKYYNGMKNVTCINNPSKWDPESHAYTTGATECTWTDGKTTDVPGLATFISENCKVDIHDRMCKSWIREYQRAQSCKNTEDNAGRDYTGTVGVCVSAPRYYSMNKSCSTNTNLKDVASAQECKDAIKQLHPDASKVALKTFNKDLDDGSKHFGCNYTGDAWGNAWNASTNSKYAWSTRAKQRMVCGENSAPCICKYVAEDECAMSTTELECNSKLCEWKYY